MPFLCPGSIVGISVFYQIISSNRRSGHNSNTSDSHCEFSGQRFHTFLLVALLTKTKSEFNKTRFQKNAKKKEARERLQKNQ
jgi:hypothetical protein